MVVVEISLPRRHIWIFEWIEFSKVKIMISFNILTKYQHSWKHCKTGESELSKEECLTDLSNELEAPKDRLSSSIQDIVIRHLDILHEKLMHYFSNNERETQIILDGCEILSKWISQNCLILLQKMNQNSVNIRLSLLNPNLKLLNSEFWLHLKLL